MKRLTIHLIVATICSFVGLSTYKLWAVFRPSPQIERYLSLSICELDRDPEQYDGKVVVVKGVLQGDRGRGPYIVDESCGSPPSSRAIRIPLESDQLLSVLPSWASEFSFCGSDPRAAMTDGLAADVVVTGTFKQSQIIPISVLQLSSASRQVETHNNDLQLTAR
jgi:hypothetical protein